MSALLGLAACNAVETDTTSLENIPTDKQEVIITATATPNTKTVLDDDYLTVLWKPSEEIKIFSAGESSKFTSLNTEAGTVVQFRGMISVITGISEGVGYDSNIYGLYPYDDDATLSNGVITTTLPSTQTAVADSFGDDLFITIGKSQTLSMGFYNVCSGLRFSFSESGYTSLTLSSNNGEALAGTFSVGFDNNGKPVIQSVSSPATSITVNAPAGGFVANTWYYVICLPGTYTGGITLSATKASRTGTYEITSSLTFERSRFKQVTNLDGRLTFPQGNNEIWYTSTTSDVITPDNPQAFGVNIVSNTYQNGKGIITFDGDVQSIGDYAFNECYNLQSISLPGSITSIGSYAFAMTGLFSITIPSQVQSIGTYAFYGSNLLDNIVVPSSVTSIGAHAFQDCLALMSVNIPDGLTTIPERCFAGCFADSSRPATINIPSALTTIGVGAFGGCLAFPFENLSLPNTVTDIGNEAFAHCSNIEKVYLPATTAARIGSTAFYNCDVKVYVPVATLQDYLTYAETGYYLPYSYFSPSDAVDLGLSVYWASCNLGASSPEEYGDYFAWGETDKYYNSLDPLSWKEGKEAGYTWSSYKWCDGFWWRMTKYNIYSAYGTVDNLTELQRGENPSETVDDAARYVLGGKWRMPTRANFNELLNKTNKEWTTYNGVNGWKFTSKKNPANWIFLPAAGSRIGTSPNYVGSQCHYWSSSFYIDDESDDPGPNDAWRLFGIYNSIFTDFSSRCIGGAVRGVYKE